MPSPKNESPNSKTADGARRGPRALALGALAGLWAALTADPAALDVMAGGPILDRALWALFAWLDLGARLALIEGLAAFGGMTLGAMGVMAWLGPQAGALAAFLLWLGPLRGLGPDVGVWIWLAALGLALVAIHRGLRGAALMAVAGLMIVAAVGLPIGRAVGEFCAGVGFGQDPVAPGAAQSCLTAMENLTGAPVPLGPWGLAEAAPQAFLAHLTFGARGLLGTTVAQVTGGVKGVASFAALIALFGLLFAARAVMPATPRARVMGFLLGGWGLAAAALAVFYPLLSPAWLLPWGMLLWGWFAYGMGQMTPRLLGFASLAVVILGLVWPAPDQASRALARAQFFDLAPHAPLGGRVWLPAGFEAAALLGADQTIVAPHPGQLPPDVLRMGQAQSTPDDASFFAQNLFDWICLSPAQRDRLAATLEGQLFLQSPDSFGYALVAADGAGCAVILRRQKGAA